MKIFLLALSCIFLSACSFLPTSSNSTTPIETTVAQTFPSTFTLKEGISLPTAPDTYEKLVTMIELMVEEDVMEIEVPYAHNLVELDLYDSYLFAYGRAYQNVNATHIEYTSNTMVYITGYRIDTEGNFFMTLERQDNRFTNEEIAEQNAFFREQVGEIFQELQNSGAYREDMDDFEKIKALFDFTMGHLSYDYDYEYADMAFTAYGAVTARQVVCQGYVALFNALLRLAGFEAEGVIGVSLDNGEGHIWTRVKLGDTWHYFDPTYADRPTWTQEEGDLMFNYTYFDMTDEIMLYDRKTTYYMVNNDTLKLP